MGSFKSKLLNGFAWRLSFFISSFILNIFIANKLGAAGSGLFYLLLNNIAFVVLFMSIGLDSSIAYFNSRKEIDASQLLSLSIIYSLLACVALLIFYFVGAQFNFITVSPLAPYLIINIGGILLANCVAAILFSSEDNITPNLTFTLINILLILLLAGISLLKNIYLQVEFTKIYLIVTALPSVVFVTYLYLRKISFGFARPNYALIKRIISFSFQSFVNNLFYALLLRCDYWLVDHFCSTSDLGNYLQANKLTQIILLVPSLASFSLFPLIVSHIHQEKEINSKLFKLISIYFYIGLVMCICVISVGYWIFPWLYGNGFAKMYPSFVLLSPGILLLAAAYPLSTFYSGKNLIRLKITGLFISIIILIALDLVLIPQLNIYGAAISSSLAYGFYFFYLLLKFKKINNLKLPELLSISTLIKENIPAFFTKSNSDEN